MYDVGDVKRTSGALVTESTELMSAREACNVAKYDGQDVHSASGSSNPSQSTLSNNSQNRLYEKLGFPRHQLQTIAALGINHRRTGQGGREGSRPPWIWETSKIRADEMGNSGIQGTEFF